MESPTLFRRVPNDIVIANNDIKTYNDSSPDSKYKVSDFYSQAITEKINSLKNNIYNISQYTPIINEQSLKNSASLKLNKLELGLENYINGNPNSRVYKQKEIDTLRGKIYNSNLANSSRILLYIIYIFITLIIIGGLISMYWFPSNGRLNIFIAIIAVLIFLLTFYQ